MYPSPGRLARTRPVTRTPLPFNCLHSNDKPFRSTKPAGWADGRSMPTSFSPLMALASQEERANLPPFDSLAVPSAMIGGMGSSPNTSGAVQPTGRFHAELDRHLLFRILL